jgi:hypothetical protein
MAASPTQRSLDYARRQGWLPGVVERWNPHARIRQDLFGFVDLVVVDDEPGVLAVQATSGANVASRLRKIRELETGAPARWLRAGNRIEVWGWRKAANGRWQLRREPVELDAVQPLEVAE